MGKTFPSIIFHSVMVYNMFMYPAWVKKERTQTETEVLHLHSFLLVTPPALFVRGLSPAGLRHGLLRRRPPGTAGRSLYCPPPSVPRNAGWDGSGTPAGTSTKQDPTRALAETSATGAGKANRQETS